MGSELEFVIWLGNSEVEEKVPAILVSGVLVSELGGMLNNSGLRRLLKCPKWTDDEEKYKLGLFETEAPGNCDNELGAKFELMILLGNSGVEEKVSAGNRENELEGKFELMIWL